MATTDELKLQRDAAKLQIVKATLALAKMVETHPGADKIVESAAAFLSSPGVLWALNAPVPDVPIS